MKTKILLIALSLLIGLQVAHAQYLVSAEEIASRDASQIETILTDGGWNTIFMDLNDVIIYKITYNTTDVHGNSTVASGALYVPQIDVCDTLPLVSYQHGTQFKKTSVPSTTVYYEEGFLFSGNGYITTLPDYLGLGDNQGFHPYVHWESEATASIDLIRAAREFLTDSLQIWDNNQLFLTGYSQGGHATMAIHKYITDNNLQNEFNIVASAPMSGPFPLYDVQLPGMLDDDSTYYASEFFPYVFASYQLVYGNLYENYNEYYDPPYDAIIPSWLASGSHSSDEWAELIPDNFYDFMQDTVVNNIMNDPNHPFNIDLRLNDLHNWVPDEPVRMYYCGMDSMVFPQNSITAQETMIALGAPDVQAIELDPSGDHNGCFIPATAAALGWFNNLRVECEMVITSILSVKRQPEISLYPNPVKDIATFSSEEIISFEIYNMTGSLIVRRVDNKVDMSGMKPGIYFVLGFDKYSYPLYKGKIIKN